MTKSSLNGASLPTPTEALVATLVVMIVLDEAAAALGPAETGSMVYGILGALAWGTACFLVTGVVLIRLLN